MVPGYSPAPRRFGGLHVGLDDGFENQALAVGDTCLFHIRDRKLLSVFPLCRSADFVCSPWLIGSRGFTGEMMAGRELRCAGEFQAGDRLWLMTDALAQWFLRRTEAGGEPWAEVEARLASPTAEVRPPIDAAQPVVQAAKR